MSGSGWEELQRPAPRSVRLGDAELRAGSRVRLWPKAGGDVFDLVLAGRVGIVEAVEQDIEGRISLAVVAEDDPGRELGFARQPGHRFFFGLEEVQPMAQAREAPPPARRRILVAGIGNVFLGDDGFGVALAERLAERELPEGVEVVDFGIRGMDLAYAMQEDLDAVIMLDATPRGEPPGTLYVIEADTGGAEVSLDAHGMDPVHVLALVRAFGSVPPRTLVVGCEPLTRMRADEDELLVELSEPVRGALERAEELVGSLLEELIAANPNPEVGRP